MALRLRLKRVDEPAACETTKAASSASRHLGGNYPLKLRALVRDFAADRDVR